MIEFPYEVVQDAPFHCRPRFDSSTAVALAWVSHQAGTDHRIATRVKMRSKYLVYKSLFGFALDMDEQSGHCADSLSILQQDDRRSRSFPKVDRGYSPLTTFSGGLH